MRGQITKRSVDSLKAAATEYFFWDVKLAGFGVRVQATGARSYVVKYRAGGGRAAWVAVGRGREEPPHVDRKESWTCGGALLVPHIVMVSPS